LKASLTRRVTRCKRAVTDAGIISASWGARRIKREKTRARTENKNPSSLLFAKDRAGRNSANGAPKKRRALSGAKACHPVLPFTQLSSNSLLKFIFKNNIHSESFLFLIFCGEKKRPIRLIFQENSQ
jgi:hypothetical protein